MRKSDQLVNRRPRVIVSRASGQTRAVVLVLHGGKSVSRAVSQATDLSVLRMIPFAWATRRQVRRDGVAVWRLRYRYAGWNGSEDSPVADARWALAEVRRRHGDIPVTLLGHSMGGRAVLRVADDPSVGTVITLAPWLPPGEPVEGIRHRRVVILHGDHDRITSAAESVDWAKRAQPLATSVLIRLLRGGEHSLLRRGRLWHQLAVAFVVHALAHEGVLKPDKQAELQDILERNVSLLM